MLRISVQVELLKLNHERRSKRGLSIARRFIITPVLAVSSQGSYSRYDLQSSTRLNTHSFSLIPVHLAEMVGGAEASNINGVDLHLFQGAGAILSLIQHVVRPIQTHHNGLERGPATHQHIQASSSQIKTTVGLLVFTFYQM